MRGVRGVAGPGLEKVIRDRGGQAGHGPGPPVDDRLPGGRIPQGAVALHVLGVRRNVDRVFQAGRFGDAVGLYGIVLQDRNRARYPARHRLDVSLRWVLEKSWGRMTPYLSVINVYNRKNVLFYFFEYSETPPIRTGISMFPVLPTVGIEVSF